MTATDDGPVTVYDAPAAEAMSEDFEVSVGGRPVPVYVCRVSAVPHNQIWPGYQRPLDQTELASFAAWDMAGAAEVEVVSRRPVESVAVRPSSRGIVPQVHGRRIRFTLPGPGQVTVEVNGLHHALHLFADAPPAAPPDRQDPNVRWFGAGVHDVGPMTLTSGQTIYLAGGAVVYGSVQAQDAANLRILGRGILDSSKLPRGRGGGSIRLTDCRDIEIDGVILRDPAVWCLSTFGCQDVRISNVKLIGLWRYNSDGIDICNSRDVVIRDSFIRSYDDSIVIKGMPRHADKPVHNVLAERCVIWNDWGRALEIGAETCAPQIADVTFRDIDIIRTSYAAMDIQHGDNAAVRNITFEDIDIEIDDVNDRPTIQKSPDDRFVPDPDFCPRLMVIVIAPTGWTKDTERGTVADVTFRDIRVTGTPRPASTFDGFDDAHNVTGVRIENLSFNGHRATTLELAGVRIGKHAEVACPATLDPA
ncbi:MAG: glycosyl hydrolase family 28 protein [Phycisphaeraceae bacterium]